MASGSGAVASRVVLRPILMPPQLPIPLPPVDSCVRLREISPRSRQGHFVNEWYKPERLLLFAVIAPKKLGRDFWMTGEVNPAAVELG